MTTPHFRPVSYTAAITAQTLVQFGQRIRVWDTPQSAVEGARVVCEITAPTCVDVIAELYEPYSNIAERVSIRYQNHAGWVLAMQLTRVV